MQRIATSDGVAQIDGLAHHIAIDIPQRLGKGEFIRSGNVNVISFQRPRFRQQGTVAVTIGKRQFKIAQHNRIWISFAKRGEGQAEVGGAEHVDVLLHGGRSASVGGFQFQDVTPSIEGGDCEVVGHLEGVCT